MTLRTALTRTVARLPRSTISAVRPATSVMTTRGYTEGATGGIRYGGVYCPTSYARSISGREAILANICVPTLKVTLLGKLIPEVFTSALIGDRGIGPDTLSDQRCTNPNLTGSITGTPSLAVKRQPRITTSVNARRNACRSSEKSSLLKESIWMTSRTICTSLDL